MSWPKGFPRRLSTHAPAFAFSPFPSQHWHCSLYWHINIRFSLLKNLTEGGKILCLSAPSTLLKESTSLYNSHTVKTRSVSQYSAWLRLVKYAAPQEAPTLLSGLQTALLYWLTAQTAAVEPPSLCPSKHSRPMKSVHDVEAVYKDRDQCLETYVIQTCKGTRTGSFQCLLRGAHRSFKRNLITYPLLLWTVYVSLERLVCLNCERWRGNMFSFLCREAQELPPTPLHRQEAQTLWWLLTALHLAPPNSCSIYH